MVTDLFMVLGIVNPSYNVILVMDTVDEHHCSSSVYSPKYCAWHLHVCVELLYSGLFQFSVRPCYYFDLCIKVVYLETKEFSC